MNWPETPLSGDTIEDEWQQHQRNGKSIGGDIGLN